MISSKDMFRGFSILLGFNLRMVFAKKSSLSCRFFLSLRRFFRKVKKNLHIRK